MRGDEPIPLNDASPSFPTRMGESELGNAPSHKLFELVMVEKNESVIIPRKFADYSVSVGNAPGGVTIIEKI